MWPKTWAKKVESFLVSLLGILTGISHPLCSMDPRTGCIALLVVLTLQRGQGHFSSTISYSSFSALHWCFFSPHCLLHALWKILLKTCTWAAKVIYTLNQRGVNMISILT